MLYSTNQNCLLESWDEEGKEKVETMKLSKSMPLELAKHMSAVKGQDKA